MKSKLINIVDGGFTHVDFAIDENQFAQLRDCEVEGTEVEILSLAVDGPWGGYFDVLVDNEFVVPAVSGVHLVTICDILKNGDWNGKA